MHLHFWLKGAGVGILLFSSLVTIVIAEEISDEISDCFDDEFECKDGTCVTLEDKCNGKPECPDKSDEENCGKPPPAKPTPAAAPSTPKPTAAPNKVETTTKQPVVPSSKPTPAPPQANTTKPGVATKVNTDDDEDSDEEDLDSNCDEEEFECMDGSCITLEDRCDGTPDCPDSSDELSCDAPETTLLPTQAPRKTGTTKKPAWLCKNVVTKSSEWGGGWVGKIKFPQDITNKGWKIRWEFNFRPKTVSVWNGITTQKSHLIWETVNKGYNKRASKGYSLVFQVTNNGPKKCSIVGITLYTNDKEVIMCPT